jgi:hypothetical protein
MRSRELQPDPRPECMITASRKFGGVVCHTRPRVRGEGRVSSVRLRVDSRIRGNDTYSITSLPE